MEPTTFRPPQTPRPRSGSGVHTSRSAASTQWGPSSIGATTVTSTRRAPARSTSNGRGPDSRRRSSDRGRSTPPRSRGHPETCHPDPGLGSEWSATPKHRTRTADPSGRPQIAVAAQAEPIGARHGHHDHQPHAHRTSQSGPSRAHRPRAPWMDEAACAGRTPLFFGIAGERPERRARREARARKVCADLPGARARAATWPAATARTASGAASPRRSGPPPATRRCRSAAAACRTPRDRSRTGACAS